MDANVRGFSRKSFLGTRLCSQYPTSDDDRVIYDAQNFPHNVKVLIAKSVLHVCIDLFGSPFFSRVILAQIGSIVACERQTRRVCRSGRGKLVTLLSKDLERRVLFLNK